jgi:hypothetical protein
VSEAPADNTPTKRWQVKVTYLIAGTVLVDRFVCERVTYQGFDSGALCLTVDDVEYLYRTYELVVKTPHPPE